MNQISTLMGGQAESFGTLRHRSLSNKGLLFRVCRASRSTPRTGATPPNIDQPWLFRGGSPRFLWASTAVRLKTQRLFR